MSSAKALGEARRALTAEQAREVRLSRGSNREMSQAFGVEITAIERLRKGLTYGPLLEDERAALAGRQQSNNRFRTADYVLLIGDRTVRGGHQDRQEAMDAEYECKHGRLSHDSTPPCGCWLGEIAPVVDLPEQMTLIPEVEELAA